MNVSPELFDYGIQTEKSDIRAHVAVAAHRIIVFRTPLVLRLIQSGKYPSATATQPGAIGPTANGYKLPVGDIPDLRELRFESYNWNAFPDHSASTSDKGKGAVDVVCKLLRRGRFPLWIEADEDDRHSIQILGTDIVVFAKQKIQVKCDWFAGRKEWNSRCSGNVYIQISEKNPLKRY